MKLKDIKPLGTRVISFGGIELTFLSSASDEYIQAEEQFVRHMSEIKDKDKETVKTLQYELMGSVVTGWNLEEKLNTHNLMVLFNKRPNIPNDLRYAITEHDQFIAKNE